VECAWSAVRHDGYLKSLYHRHVMKWGGYRSQIAKKKAIVVVAHALIVIIWHILATGKPYHELGADYFTSRLDPERESLRLIARLEALGHQVSLQTSCRLTPRPQEPGSASAPPGAAACPAKDHSRIRREDRWIAGDGQGRADSRLPALQPVNRPGTAHGRHSRCIPDSFCAQDSGPATGRNLF
jgi:hypothetical protein